MNIRTVISSLSQAKEDCYALATVAYNNGNQEDQRKLYAIADAALIAINAALALEAEQEKDTNGQAFTALDDFSEIA